MKHCIQKFQLNNHKNHALKKEKDKYMRLYLKRVKSKKKNSIKKFKSRRELNFKMKFKNVHLAQLLKGQDKCQIL